MSAVEFLHIRPAKPAPLCQYELLLLAHPLLQSGSGRVAAETCGKAAQGWLTVDVYGSVRGRVIEDMRCLFHGQDIYDLLPDNILQEITAYVVNNE